MNPLVLMAAIVAVPAVLVTLLRVKAAYVFMSLCVGSVLSLFVGDAALDMAQTFMKSYSPTTEAIIQVGLLLAPVVLTIIFLTRSVSRSSWLINLLPAVLTGVVLLLLVVPFLSDATQSAIYATNVWSQLSQYQPIIVSVAVFMSLAQLWSTGKPPKDKRHKKK